MTRKSQDLHDSPRELTGGVLYATRRIPRPLRPGDRIRDRLGTYNGDTYHTGYPSSNLFGTVLTAPAKLVTTDFTGTFYSAQEWAEVAFDDGVLVSLPVGDLVRL